jgi:hypothetical protein
MDSVHDIGSHYFLECFDEVVMQCCNEELRCGNGARSEVQEADRSRSPASCDVCGLTPVIDIAWETTLSLIIYDASGVFAVHLGRHTL